MTIKRAVAATLLAVVAVVGTSGAASAEPDHPKGSNHAKTDRGPDTSKN